jgi:hypothetical protein
MNKLFTAAFLFALLFLFGCSSTPSGTDKIGDILDKGASAVGKNVIVVGTAETKTGFSSEKLFRLYDGSKYIWIMRSDEIEEPPQGVKIRVSGTVQQKEFNVLGKVFYIGARQVEME